MKTRLTQIILATFLVVFLIGGNVNAKGTELTIASSLENIVEPKLEVEAWMVNETNWNTFEKSTCFFMVNSEESLEVEAWMLDQSNWIDNSYEYSTAEADNALLLEDWMVNEVYWN